MTRDRAFREIVDRHLKGMLAAVRTVYELDSAYGNGRLAGALTQEIRAWFEDGQCFATLVVGERADGEPSDRVRWAVRPVLRVSVTSRAFTEFGREVDAGTADLARYLAEANGGRGPEAGAAPFEIALPDEPPWVGIR